MKWFAFFCLICNFNFSLENENKCHIIYKKKYNHWKIIPVIFIGFWGEKIQGQPRQSYIDEILGEMCSYENQLLQSIFQQENFINDDKLMITTVYDGIITNKSSFFDDNIINFQGQSYFNYTKFSIVDTYYDVVNKIYFNSFNLFNGNAVNIDGFNFENLFNNYTSFVCPSGQKDYFSSDWYQNYNLPIKEWMKQLFNKHGQEFSWTNGTNDCYNKYFKKFEPTVLISNTTINKIKNDFCQNNWNCIDKNIFNSHNISQSLNFLGYPFDLSLDDTLKSETLVFTRGNDGKFIVITGKKIINIDGLDYTFSVGKTIDTGGIIVDNREHLILNPVLNNLYRSAKKIQYVFYNKIKKQITCFSKLSYIFYQCDFNGEYTFFVNNNDYVFKIFNVISYPIDWSNSQSINPKNINSGWDFSNIQLNFFDKILWQKADQANQCRDENSWKSDFLSPLNQTSLMMNINNAIKKNPTIGSSTIDPTVKIPMWISDLSWQLNSNYQTIESNIQYGFKPFLKNGIRWSIPLNNLLIGSNDYNYFHYQCSLNSNINSNIMYISIDNITDYSFRTLKVKMDNEDIWIQSSSKKTNIYWDIWSRIPNGTLWDGTLWIYKIKDSFFPFSVVPLNEDFLNIYKKSRITHNNSWEYPLFCSSILNQNNNNGFFHFNNHNIGEMLNNSTYDVNYGFHSINFLDNWLEIKEPQEKTNWVNNNHMVNGSFFYYSIYLFNNYTDDYLYNVTFVSDEFNIIGCGEQCFSLDFNGFPKGITSMNLDSFIAPKQEISQDNINNTNVKLNKTTNEFFWQVHKTFISREDKNYPCSLYIEYSLIPQLFLICFNTYINDFPNWRWMYNLDKNIIDFNIINEDKYWNILLINGDTIKISKNSGIGFGTIDKKKYPKNLFTYNTNNFQFQNLFNDKWNISMASISFYYPHEIFLSSRFISHGTGSSNSFMSTIFFNNVTKSYNLCYPDSTDNYLCFSGDWYSSMIYYNAPSNENFNYLKQYKYEVTNLKNWLYNNTLMGNYYAFNRTNAYTVVNYEDFICQLMITNKLKKQLMVAIGNYCIMESTQSKFIELSNYPQWNDYHQQWHNNTMQYFICQGNTSGCTFNLLNGTNITCDIMECWSDISYLNNNFLDRLYDTFILNTVKQYINNTVYLIGLHPKKNYFLPHLMAFSLNGTLTERQILSDINYWATYSTPLLFTYIFFNTALLGGICSIKQRFFIMEDKWEKFLLISQSFLSIIPDILGLIAITSIYYSNDKNKILDDNYIYQSTNNFNELPNFMGRYWGLILIELFITFIMICYHKLSLCWNSLSLVKTVTQGWDTFTDKHPKLCCKKTIISHNKSLEKNGKKKIIYKNFTQNQMNILLIKIVTFMGLRIANQQDLINNFPDDSITFIQLKI